eukprot:TRINITY_DN62764_c0_g1_i1.p1 TRINITY_DN62764_c0_g1~~TRINITY_DN62764_c0_g1_i1.p1  ORF type:complete len:578 (+),score=47.39 TRINITY_DN62764_c0_g1_i1:241-1734(+)
MDVNQSAYTSFTYLVGLFIAFRSAQSYCRFWEGSSTFFLIGSNLFDVASSVIAFSRTSTVVTTTVQDFRHTVVILISVLHALILAELSTEGRINGSEAAFDFDVFDPSGFDSESIIALRESESPVDLVFQWIQGIIVDASEAGLIAVPAPFTARVFQELNQAFFQFHSAMKITEVPFPFPYKAATYLILVMHWVLTPLVAYAWSQSVSMCFMLSFVQVLSLWSFHGLALELENPFGTDLNDLDVRSGHESLNMRLGVLLGSSIQTLPSLAGDSPTNKRDERSSLADRRTKLSAVFAADMWAPCASEARSSLLTTRTDADPSVTSRSEVVVHDAYAERFTPVVSTSLSEVMRDAQESPHLPMIQSCSRTMIYNPAVDALGEQIDRHGRVLERVDCMSDTCCARRWELLNTAQNVEICFDDIDGIPTEVDYAKVGLELGSTMCNTSKDTGFHPTRCRQRFDCEETMMSAVRIGVLPTTPSLGPGMSPSRAHRVGNVVRL